MLTYMVPYIITAALFALTLVSKRNQLVLYRRNQDS
jgi:hypothetical protein